MSKLKISATANTPKRRFRSQKICDAEIEFSAEAEVPLFHTETNFGVSTDNNVLSAHTSAAMDKGWKVAPGRGRKSALSLEDQLLVTLMRLRLGRLEQELAYMFNVYAGTISRVFNKWINFL